MKREAIQNNPALQFISAAEPEPPVKKEAPPDPAGDPPEGYRIDPKYIEKKTQRLQLVLQPSLYRDIKEAAAAAGLSVNDYCHRALKEITTKEDSEK